MLKKVLQWKATALLLTVIVCFNISSGVCAESYDYSAYPEAGFAVKEINSGDFIMLYNENERFYPGSVTKLMSVLCAYDLFTANEIITVSDEMLSLVLPDSSTAEIEEGENLTFEQLCYATLLPSGNDAARILAVAAGQKLSEGNGRSAEEYMQQFVETMNEKAFTLGMHETNFVNPDGYDDYQGYTTPLDMLKLGEETAKNAFIMKICSTPEYVFTSNLCDHEWINSDMFLHIFDPEEENEANVFYDSRVRGMKTGFTDIGQRCFMFYACEGNETYVGIVMKIELRPLTQLWTVTGSVIDYSFDMHTVFSPINEDNRILFYKISNPANIFTHELALYAENEELVCIENEAYDNYQYELLYNAALVAPSNEGKLHLNSDIAPGDTIMTAVYSYDGEAFAKVNYLAETEFKRMSVWYIIIYAIIVSGAVGIMTAPLRIKRKKHKKRNA